MNRSQHSKRTSADIQSEPSISTAYPYPKTNQHRDYERNQQPSSCHTPTSRMVEAPHFRIIWVTILHSIDQVCVQTTVLWSRYGAKA
jgi:hypothetical protein